MTSLGTAPRERRRLLWAPSGPDQVTRLVGGERPGVFSSVNSAHSTLPLSLVPGKLPWQTGKQLKIQPSLFTSSKVSDVLEIVPQSVFAKMLSVVTPSAPVSGAPGQSEPRDALSPGAGCVCELDV